MPNSSFIKSVVAEASGVSVVSFSLTINGTVAGHFLSFHAETTYSGGAFNCSISDSQGNTWHLEHAGGNGINMAYNTSALPGGIVTVTFTINLGPTFTNWAATVCEWSEITANSANSEWGFGNSRGQIASGGGTTVNVTGEQVIWQPLTLYDGSGVTGPDQVQDTLSPFHLQFADNANALSGATTPAWNHAGGNTTDGAQVWTDSGETTPTGAVVIYAIGYQPFVEHLTPVGGSFTFIASISNAAVGIDVYCDVLAFINSQSNTLTKSTDTYQLDYFMDTIEGVFSAPPSKAPILSTPNQFPPRFSLPFRCEEKSCHRFPFQ